MLLNCDHAGCAKDGQTVPFIPKEFDFEKNSQTLSESTSRLGLLGSLLCPSNNNSLINLDSRNVLSGATLFSFFLEICVRSTYGEKGVLAKKVLVFFFINFIY